MQVRLTALAERDLQGIYEYLARESPAAARRVLDHLLRKAERLQSFPASAEPAASAGPGSWSP